MVDSILLSRFSIIKIPCKLGHIIANIKNFDIWKSAFEKKKSKIHCSRRNELILTWGLDFSILHSKQDLCALLVCDDRVKYDFHFVLFFLQNQLSPEGKRVSVYRYQLAHTKTKSSTKIASFLTITFNALLSNISLACKSWTHKANTNHNLVVLACTIIQQSPCALNIYTQL